MMDFPGSQRLVRDGSVLIDPLPETVPRAVALQSGPDSVSSSHFHVPSDGGGDVSGVQCQKGSVVGIITLDADVDAAKSGKIPLGAQS